MFAIPHNQRPDFSWPYLLVAASIFLSPARHLIADEAPQTAVFAMDFDGNNLRKVVQAPDRKSHGAPAWSHDGKFVLFHAYVKSTETEDSHIYVVRDDGSDIKDLGAGANATWSPDDQQIVFSVPEHHTDKGNPGVWIMNADGKAREQLFPGTSPRFAPDGSRILYVSSHEGNQSIYVYDMIEGNSKKILQEPYQKKPGNATWSPDGKKVAFVDERTGKFEAIIIDSNGNAEIKPVIRFRGWIGGPMAWAPAEKIAFWVKAKEQSDPQRLHFMEAGSEDPPIPLPKQSEGTLNFDPAWSSDGQRLLFVSDRVLSAPAP